MIRELCAPVHHTNPLLLRDRCPTRRESVGGSEQNGTDTLPYCVHDAGAESEITATEPLEGREGSFPNLAAPNIWASPRDKGQIKCVSN
jgi:hypothetical protein